MHLTLTSNKSNISPFLKWAGGKRWLVSRYSNFFPTNYKNYIEPFLGSGAVFFHLTPNRAVLSDKNKELIDVYRALKYDFSEVMLHLKEHHTNHDKQYYYDIRSNECVSSTEKAARFIYLNRTCWNGLYRVNRNGIFNVPIGTKNKVILEGDNFEAVSMMLKNVDLLDSDFEAVINMSSKNDFVFIDPPYTVKHNNNGFVKYNETLFSWSDQVRLRDATARAITRGVQVLITNAAHDSVEQLYEDKIFQVTKLTRHSVLAGTVKDRKQCEELIICGKNGHY